MKPSIRAIRAWQRAQRRRAKIKRAAQRWFAAYERWFAAYDKLVALLRRPAPDGLSRGVWWPTHLPTVADEATHGDGR